MGEALDVSEASPLAEKQLQEDDKGSQGLIAPFALCLLALQNASTLLLQHKLQSRIEMDLHPFNPTSTIIATDLVRLVVSTVLARREHSTISWMSFVQDTISQDHRQCIVPALLYAVATMLQVVGAFYLQLLPYLALCQLKNIITPLFSSMLLHRRFQVKEIICVAALATGILLLQLGTMSSLHANTMLPRTNAPDMLRGTGAMFLAGCGVASAPVYMELILKKNSQALMVRNAQLSFYSLVATLVALCFSKSGVWGLFDGFTAAVWGLVSMQALGGFLVAWVVRLTSTIAKNYSQGFGFMCATIVSLALAEEAIGFETMAGIFVIVVSVVASIS